MWKNEIKYEIKKCEGWRKCYWNGWYGDEVCIRKPEGGDKCHPDYRQRTSVNIKNFKILQKLQKGNNNNNINNNINNNNNNNKTTTTKQQNNNNNNNNNN